MIITESFKIQSLSDSDVEKLYNVYKDSYERETGFSWDFHKFKYKAYNWIFFGNLEGGIALRPQNSGLFKFVATYGHPKQVVKALEELKSELQDKPIWGAMSGKLRDMLEKATKEMFKSPPKLFVKTILPFIKKAFGDVVTGVSDSGALLVNIDGLGTVEKFFIANSKYYEWVLNRGLEEMKLPTIVRTPLVFMLKKLI